MNYQLSFANLPFKPDRSQVIYVEEFYDEQANRFITGLGSIFSLPL